MLKNAISLYAMILFSPAKINIGLQVIERRMDGFHNLQSLLFPVGLCDIMEIRISSEAGRRLQFHQSGIQFKDSVNKNLCVRAWGLFTHECPLPPISMHLHKQIPVGAGLGGGSSNASITLKGLNLLAGNSLSQEQLQNLAIKLGSDCPFFLQENPMMMHGRGDILSPLPIQFKPMHLILIFPQVHVSTQEAYSDVNPSKPNYYLTELIEAPLDQWKKLIVNDFEFSLFKKYPELRRIKETLYQEGAVYASLSGSGSSLYGLFSAPPVLPKELEQYVIWTGNIDMNILKWNPGQS